MRGEIPFGCVEIHDGLTHFWMNLPLLKFFLGQVDPGNLWCSHLVFAGEFLVPVREQGKVGCHMLREKGLFPFCVDVWLILVHPSIWVSVERSKNMEDVLKTLECHPFLHEADMLLRNVNYFDEMLKNILNCNFLFLHLHYGIMHDFSYDCVG